MNQKHQIEVKDIYISRLSYRRVTNKEGWMRWEPIPERKSSGNQQLDHLAKILARTPLPAKMEIAEQMNMSRDEMNYFLRVYTGKTLVEVLEKYKVLIGMELLAYTDLSIQDISWCAGCSRSYFSTLFTKRVGVSPREYRYENQKPSFMDDFKWDLERLKIKN